jgi:threonine dehydrogenase-like Zn-dependent dehydrogenase
MIRDEEREIMERVRAAIIPAPGRATEVVELPVPELEPGSALLEVELSEVCGTDVHLRAGRLAGVPYPLIPGHVSVGRLRAVRGTMTDVHGARLHEGDAVTFLDVHGTCNACWHCLVAKASTRCPSRRVYGITYGAVDGLAGGWAEAVYLRPGTRVIPLGGVDPQAFMAGGCSLPTALHGVERADIMFGDSVLVLGSGPVGLSSIILARMRGAGTVLCIGGPAGRLATAASVGAAGVLDFTAGTAEERLAWVLQHTGGRGADVTIEATGAPVAVVDAMRYTRDAGRVVVLGQYTDHGTVAFNPHTELNRKHLEVRGVWGSDYSHFHRSVELLRDPARAAAWLGIPLETYGLDETNLALDRVAGGEVVKALVRPG